MQTKIGISTISNNKYGCISIVYGFISDMNCDNSDKNSDYSNLNLLTSTKFD